MNQNEQFDFDLDKEPEVQNTSKPSFDSKEIVYCTKCGQPMLRTARCCMHCGELNMLSQKNSQVNSYFTKGKKIKKKEEKKGLNKLPNLRETTLDENGMTKKEKRYTSRKNILSFIMLIILFIVLLNYKVIVNFINDIRKEQYLRQVTKIVEQVKTKYKDKDCISTALDDRWYLSFENSHDLFDTSLSLFTFDYFRGYIEIINNEDGTRDYIISITDGKYGFENVMYTTNLDKDIITKIDSFELPYTSIYCP